MLYGLVSPTGKRSAVAAPPTQNYPPLERYYDNKPSTRADVSNPHTVFPFPEEPARVYFRFGTGKSRRPLLLVDGDIQSHDSEMPRSADDAIY